MLKFFGQSHYLQVNFFFFFQMLMPYLFLELLRETFWHACPI